MHRLGTLLAAAALAAVPACQKEARDKTEEAAENVQEQREDVREEAKDLREDVQDHREAVRDQTSTDTMENTGEDVGEERQELREETGELKTAEAELAVRKGNLVARMRAVHDVVRSQPVLINSLAPLTPLTTNARADLAEKMQVFQMRIDEAGNAIEALAAADAASFEERDDAAEQAMDRLEDARENAWEALNEGDRLEPS